MAIYMQFKDVTGDATDAGHVGWCLLETLTWTKGIHKSISVDAHTSTRLPEQTDHSDLTITKLTDGGSADMINSITQAEKGVVCTIEFVATGAPGNVYLQIVLYDTYLVQVDIAHDSPSGRPMETWTLNFARIDYNVWPLNPDNTQGDPKRAHWP